MKLIGIKRMIILAVLIAINAAIAAGYFLWIEPSREEAQSKLASTKSEISKLQSKIQNTKVELQEYQTNLPKYKELEAKGFMSGQDRFQISRDLDSVRTQAHLEGFSFRIDDLQTIDNPDAKEANMKVLNSRINVENVSSLLDINLYDFIDLMMTAFPTHVRLDSLEIDRKDPLDNLALQKIANKDPVKLVTGKAVFDWMTYVPMAPSEIKPVKGQKK